jgi:hypothetical protein
MELNLTRDVDKTSDLQEKGKANAESRYQRLVSRRDPFLQRARDCSKVTIPSLIPDQVGGDRGRLPTPHQSLGARGLNYLASKLLISLFPPNNSFFKLETSAGLRTKDLPPELQAELDNVLVRIEGAVMRELELCNGRSSLFEAFKHLLAGGNVLLYAAEGAIRVIHLSNFVCCRDPVGNIDDIIAQEEISPDVLPEDFREQVKSAGSMADDDSDESYEKTVKLYTVVEYEGDDCYWWQEAYGQRIPGTSGKCKKDVSPWIPLRFNRIDGEEYGRGYIEEYLGDLLSLEGLYKAILEGSAAAAKVVILVDPNGTTRMATLQKAESGDIVQGSMKDVTVLELGKTQDFSVVLSTIDRIEARLQFAFLLNTAVQRPGERVTAEEIRFMSQELEAGVGGLYSILTQELQLPLVRRFMHILRKSDRLPALPKSSDGDELVRPRPVTGLEGLGRMDDRSRLADFLSTASTLLGQEVVDRMMNVGELLRRLATSSSIDPTGLIKDSQQLATEASEADQTQATEAQQQMMTAALQSPALAQVAGNYTQPGAPYGPQIQEGDPNAALPELDPSSIAGIDPSAGLPGTGIPAGVPGLPPE